jgi:hypothetical protein
MPVPSAVKDIVSTKIPTRTRQSTPNLQLPTCQPGSVLGHNVRAGADQIEHGGPNLAFFRISSATALASFAFSCSVILIASWRVARFPRPGWPALHLRRCRQMPCLGLRLSHVRTAILLRFSNMLVVRMCLRCAGGRTKTINATGTLVSIHSASTWRRHAAQLLRAYRHQDKSALQPHQEPGGKDDS